jgi:hypothetical protein
MSFPDSFSTLIYGDMYPMVKVNPLSILKNDRKTERKLISGQFGPDPASASCLVFSIPENRAQYLCSSIANV